MTAKGPAVPSASSPGGARPVVVTRRDCPWAPLPPGDPERELAGMPLRHVTGTDTPLELFALGEAALLFAGSWAGRTPYLVHEGEVVAVEGLDDYLQQDNAGMSSVQAGGSWPHNAWLALSRRSDAGPSCAWLYRWVPAPKTGERARAGSWHLVHEHGRLVTALLPWQGGMLIASNTWDFDSFTSPAQVAWLAPPVFERWTLPFCSGTFPWLIRGAEAQVLGFGCRPDTRWGDLSGPEAGLFRATSRVRGRWATERLPLPSRRDPESSPNDWTLFAEGEQLLLLEASSTTKVSWLYRLSGGAWVPEPALPEPFQVVTSDDHRLWALSGRQLLRWSTEGFLPVAHLPALEPGRDCACCRDANTAVGVWEAGPGNLWLAFSASRQGLLFNTAGGSSSVRLVSESEEPALLEQRLTWDDTCVHAVAPVLALSDRNPVNRDPWRISREQARVLLQRALQRHPEFRTVRFVHHPCFEEECISAIVPDEKTGEALARAVDPEARYHCGWCGLHCGSHPGSRPFPVFP